MGRFYGEELSATENAAAIWDRMEQSIFWRNLYCWQDCHSRDGSEHFIIQVENEFDKACDSDEYFHGQSTHLLR